jgi:hypothetical protein
MDPVTVVTEDFDDEPMRCTIVIDAELPPGKAANAAAVIGLTIGKLHPHLAGTDLVDASGHPHPGLIPIGISVLVAPATELVNVRAKALRSGLDVVDFPVQGQQTNNYAEFGKRVRSIPTERLPYVGVGIYGTRKSVGKVVGRFSLLK